MVNMVSHVAERHRTTMADTGRSIDHFPVINISWITVPLVITVGDTGPIEEASVISLSCSEQLNIFC